MITGFFRTANQALDYAASPAGLGSRLVLLHVRRDAIRERELLTG